MYTLSLITLITFCNVCFDIYYRTIDGRTVIQSLCQILSNIEANKDLDSKEISKTFSKCPPCLDLLFEAGYESQIIDNKPRLIFNKTPFSLHKRICDSLKTALKDTALFTTSTSASTYLKCEHPSKPAGFPFGVSETYKPLLTHGYARLYLDKDRLISSDVTDLIAQFIDKIGKRYLSVVLVGHYEVVNRHLLHKY